MGVGVTASTFNRGTGEDRWVIGITGGSGMPYALRLLDILTNSGIETHAIFSEAALRVLQEESNIRVSASKLSGRTLFGSDRSNLIIHNPRDIGAAPASGSARFRGMVIVPCSMASLGMIAHGVGYNLIHRAADVTIKEGRKFIIVPRETPLSTIHLENMLSLAKLGAAIVPAMPGFYHKPASIEDLVDMMVMKILDCMGVPNELVSRWKESEPDENFVNVVGDNVRIFPLKRESKRDGAS